MLTTIMGAGVFIITVVIFWYCLPRGGQMHRFVGTEWEPYIGVAFTSGIALSFTMILSGILNLLTPS
jgi:hypothetical protein